MSKKKNDVVDVDGITKEAFMTYLKKKKELDKEFGGIVVEKAKQKEDAYERQKKQQRDRYAELFGKDEEFTKQQKEKGRRAYERKKERLATASRTPTETPMVSDEEEGEAEVVGRVIPRFNMRINTLF